MTKGRRFKGKDAVAAEVFLRTASGRTLDEIAEGPMPDDLSPFRAPAAARAEVHRFLLRAGFKVYSDEQNLTLHIEGRAETFTKVFGIDPARTTALDAKNTILLRPPPEIRAFVDKITVLPKPELF